MNPEAFKYARKTLALTPLQAAKVLGYGSAVRISEIEHGKMNPSDSVARLMVAYMAGYRPDDWPN